MGTRKIPDRIVASAGRIQTVLNFPMHSVSISHCHSNTSPPHTVFSGYINVPSSALLTRHAYSWFQTFAVFWMLYSFFWVIPLSLNVMWRRFGKSWWSVPKRRHTKFRRREITQKLEYKAFLIFWVFNSRPVSLLATIEASLFFPMALVSYAIQNTP